MSHSKTNAHENSERPFFCTGCTLKKVFGIINHEDNGIRFNLSTTIDGIILSPIQMSNTEAMLRRYAAPAAQLALSLIVSSRISHHPHPHMHLDHTVHGNRHQFKEPIWIKWNDLWRIGKLPGRWGGIINLFSEQFPDGILFKPLDDQRRRSDSDNLIKQICDNSYLNSKDGVIVNVDAEIEKAHVDELVKKHIRIHKPAFAYKRRIYEASISKKMKFDSMEEAREWVLKRLS